MTDEAKKKIGLAHEQRNEQNAEPEAPVAPEEPIAPEVRLKIGSELAAFGKRYGGIDLDIKRDKSPIEPAIFE